VSKPEKNTYGDILRASSIMGGAQALNYLVGMVRVKIIAVLLGPAGVGLIGLYSSALGLVGTVTSLGIASSGVREVALAHGQDDPQAVARTVTVLRRACWATGLLGWALSAAAAVPLSRWAFGDTAHAAAIAVLGVTLLLGAISGGQTALLQGVRRIGDLARIQVVAMLLNTVVAIGLIHVAARGGHRAGAGGDGGGFPGVLLVVCQACGAAPGGTALAADMARNPAPCQTGVCVHVERLLLAG
jgi:antigen flippase